MAGTNEFQVMTESFRASAATWSTLAAKIQRTNAKDMQHIENSRVCLAESYALLRRVSRDLEFKL